MKHRLASFGGCVFALTLLLAAPPSARAGIITLFSDFGPNGSFNTAVGDIFGDEGATNFAVADQFKPGVSGNLTSLTLALGRVSGSATTVNVRLDADNAGKPGATLISFTANVSAPFGTNTVTLDTTTGPLLQAGTPYWLVLSATGAEFGFNLNNINAVGLHGLSLNGGAFAVQNTVLDAFSVSGNATPDTAVPEPASLALFAIGSLGAGGYCGWRRRQQIRRRRGTRKA